MLHGPDMIISDIVRSDYRTADVFKKYNINYCCNGQVTMADACSKYRLEYTTIAKELEEAIRDIRLSPGLQFNEWKIDFLVDYIINVHHAYLLQALPSLESRIALLLETHETKLPGLPAILPIFKELSLVLMNQLKYEEEIIFPYIKQVDSAYRKKETYGSLFVRTLRKPLGTLEKDSGLVAELLTQLRQLCNQYNTPSDTCTGRQVLYHKLREFHDDMVQHKHLENNILFPRIIPIENELLRL